MLRGDLRDKIRELWDRFWSGGIANPLTAVEQISYLIFLKRLEDIDDMEAQRAARNGLQYESRFLGYDGCRWTALRELQPEVMLERYRREVFPFLKGLPFQSDGFAHAMRDAVCLIPKASLLAAAVSIIDTLPFNDDEHDVQGDFYELLLQELSLAGKNGQFRTPRHIVQMMVELVNPQPADSVCDPAAGTAGFLVSAYRWVCTRVEQEKSFLQPHDSQYVAYDFDSTMVRLGIMNMMLHGIRTPAFHYQDALSYGLNANRHFDVILANPPFTGSLDESTINKDVLALPTTKTELLFIELCLSLLRQAGRMAVIVPEGVLFGSTRAHAELRARLVRDNNLRAVISLPPGVFKPYTGVKTAILYVEKGGSTDNVLYYEVTGDGYTLDNKRIPSPESNDLLYVPQAFRKLVLGSKEPWSSLAAEQIVRDQAWIVSRSEIEAHGFDLTSRAYKPQTETEQQLDDPHRIIGRLRSLEAEISDRLSMVELMMLRDDRRDE